MYSFILQSNPYAWIPTVLLMSLALVAHTGIRLLPWILIGEVRRFVLYTLFCDNIYIF